MCHVNKRFTLICVSLEVYDMSLSKTHVSLLREVVLDAEADSLQSGVPFLRGLIQLALKPLDVLGSGKDDKHNTCVQRQTGSTSRASQKGFYRQEFGDGVRLCAAHAAVTRPHDPPLAVGECVCLLRAVQPNGHHPPVKTRPRGQSLIREKVPFSQVGDAVGGLQDHLWHKRFLLTAWCNDALLYLTEVCCEVSTAWRPAHDVRGHEADKAEIIT